MTVTKKINKIMTVKKKIEQMLSLNCVCFLYVSRKLLMPLWVYRSSRN